MLRLFVALPLPDGVIARLSILQSGVPGASWVEPMNMHLTLRFIGEVDVTAAEEIDAMLAQIEVPAFSLELSGAGTFGDGTKARALWAGVKPSAALTHLQQKVESAVVRAGLPPPDGKEVRRKFAPHVTLARLKGAQATRLESFIAGNNLFSAGPFAVARFTLYESRLGKGGPVYIPQVDYDLVPGTE